MGEEGGGLGVWSLLGVVIGWNIMRRRMDDERFSRDALMEVTIGASSLGTSVQESNKQPNNASSQSSSPSSQHQHHQISHSIASPAAPTANAAPTTFTCGPFVGAGPSAALLMMLLSATPTLEKY